MAGTASESSGVVRSLEGSSSGCQSSEALAVWRSSDQVENGTPSTSPPYWDSDDDDDDGPKPSQLFGKHTMRIEKFSQINKREHRGEIFEAGGHQWYILIYPQGCDVCNHLSLFLCVNQPEKLLPGWSHFAQFTIAVVNKDPKKSKYSDTLHRFWRKEHDWGWKKFMELSKVVDGFLDGDTLIIKAQVQVIREKPDRPFRCLDCSYRRELVRVYLTNVEQICRRFVEERRVKLVKLLEDKARWSSFCDFWMGIDQNARCRMSRERSDSVLKVLVKHFFIEKEVTSTLVMDSLHSGLRALQGQTKGKKVRGTYSDAEETLTPILCMEKDAFVLVDDVLLLLERAAMETLPPKDEKGPQNRTKDASSGEDFGKDSIERDERRLTELGRRTIEIFVLAHLFSKIDVAYQEVVALRRQEELIREEEEAWMAESEQKSKRGIADKDKKSKKKQGKQKRNNRKGKEKGRDEKQPSVVVVEDKPAQEIPTDIRNHSLIEEAEPVVKAQLVEDVSDVLDSIDCVPEIHLPDSEERRDSDPSEIHRSTEISTVQNGERKCSSTVDDSSSTCSTHSLPSVVMNGLYKGNSVPKQKSQKSPSRGRNQQVEKTNKATGGAIDTKNQPYDAWQADDESCSCKVTAELEDALVSSLQNHKKRQAEQEHVMKKENISMQSKPIVKKEDPDVEKPAKVKPAGVPSSPRRPSKNLPSFVPSKSESKISAVNDTLLVKKPANLAETIATSKPCVHKAATTPKPTEKPTTQEVPALNEKPTAHQVPASIEKPTAQQVPASTEKPTAQQVPAPNEKPTAQQAPAPSEKLTAQHDSASTEKPKAHQPSERPMAQQVMVTAEKPTTPQFMSRPLSAPIIPAPRAPAPVVSMVQTAPSLSRSVSAAGRLGPDPSSATPNYMGQSYRNAMMGNHVVTSSSGYNQPLSPNSPVNISNSYSHPSVSGPIYLSQSPERMDLNSIRPSLSFGMVSRDVLQNGPQYMDSPLRDSSRSMNYDPSMLNNMQNGPQWMDRIQRNSSRSIDGLRFPIEYPAGLSGCQNPNGVLADEFPHIDIINDLLDDENGIVRSGLGFQPFANGPHHVNHQQQFSFQNDIGMSGDVGTSTSTCRFEYDDFHCSYIPAGGQLDSNLIPQANLQPYPSNSGQIDGLVPNQWQIGGSDLSYLGMGSSDSDGFSYHIPEYSNLASGVNGYTVFRPTNGH